MTRAPIVAISGHPGSGKTSLTKALQKRLGVPALHYDDFEMVTSLPPEKIRDWIERGSDYDEIMLEPLVLEMTGLPRRRRVRNACCSTRCLGAPTPRPASS